MHKIYNIWPGSVQQRLLVKFEENLLIFKNEKIKWRNNVNFDKKYLESSLIIFYNRVYCVVVFLFLFFTSSCVLWTKYCQFLWIVHSWLSLRFSLAFLYTWIQIVEILSIGYTENGLWTVFAHIVLWLCLHTCIYIVPMQSNVYHHWLKFSVYGFYSMQLFVNYLWQVDGFLLGLRLPTTRNLPQWSNWH
jgi:hypothetical protein